MLLAVVSVVLLSLPATAEVAGATLTGSVTYTTGAVIPGVRVSILNEATDESRSVVFDSAGVYSAPNLLSGVYDVTFTAQGFVMAIKGRVTLTVGAQQLL